MTQEYKLTISIENKVFDFPMNDISFLKEYLKNKNFELFDLEFKSQTIPYYDDDFIFVINNEKLNLNQLLNMNEEVKAVNNVLEQENLNKLKAMSDVLYMGFVNIVAYYDMDDIVFYDDVSYEDIGYDYYNSLNISYDNQKIILDPYINFDELGQRVVKEENGYMTDYGFVKFYKNEEVERIEK